MVHQFHIENMGLKTVTLKERQVAQIICLTNKKACQSLPSTPKELQSWASDWQAL